MMRQDLPHWRSWLRRILSKHRLADNIVNEVRDMAWVVSLFYAQTRAKEVSGLDIYRSSIYNKNTRYVDDLYIRAEVLTVSQ